MNNITASNANITGKISSTEGDIGGWELASGSLVSYAANAFGGFITASFSSTAPRGVVLSNRDYTVNTYSTTAPRSVIFKKQMTVGSQKVQDYNVIMSNTGSEHAISHGSSQYYMGRQSFQDHGLYTDTWKRNNWMDDGVYSWVQIRINSGSSSDSHGKTANINSMGAGTSGTGIYMGTQQIPLHQGGKPTLMIRAADGYISGSKYSQWTVGRINLTGGAFGIAADIDGSVDIDGVLSLPNITNVSASLAGATAGGGMSNFGLAGDGGSTQNITSGNTLTIAGGSGITTTAADTYTVSVAVHAATISGSLGSNASLIRSLTATGISGSSDITSVSSSLAGRLTTEEANVDTLQGRTLTAGSGLTGGGTLASDRTFNVGAGTGVTVNANDVAIGQDIATTSKPLFAAVSSSGDISGSATSTGSFGALNIDGGHFTSASLAAGGGGSGTVDVSGTPANNQIAVWTDADTLEGESTVTYESSALKVAAFLDVNEYIRHNGDNDTWIRFQNDNVAIQAGASVAWQFNNSPELSGSATSTGSFGYVHSAGAIRAGDDVIAYYSSDERLKNNIITIQNPIDKVKQLRGVEYEWNGLQHNYPSGSKDTGIIAQDVQKVLPQIVKEKKGGYLGVRHDRLVGLLVESVKEQQEQIDELKKEVEELKNDSS